MAVQQSTGDTPYRVGHGCREVQNVCSGVFGLASGFLVSSTAFSHSLVPTNSRGNRRERVTYT
jgi:hypothetical protein